MTDKLTSAQKDEPDETKVKQPVLAVANFQELLT
ncbi:hypothetical protein BV898_19179, partial [Hypsibius exemplaris]